MRSQSTFIGSAVVLSLLLGACNKPAEEPAAVPADVAATTSTSPTPQAVPAEPAAKSDKGLMTATPASAACGAGTDINFMWNVTTPGVANIEIWVGESAPDARLFAAGGLTGSQATGPWVVPGTLFVMRNQANKAEIDRLVIDGPECAPVEPSAKP